MMLILVIASQPARACTMVASITRQAACGHTSSCTGLSYSKCPTAIYHDNIAESDIIVSLHKHTV